MDKYEYRVRAEEINALIEQRQYADAVKIADTIDWRRVKSVTMLCKVSELYKMNRRYEDSKDILLLAYERQPGSRKIVYSLCELSIKLEELVQAIEYYKEFVQIAPRDTGRFILQYRLYEAQDVSLEERIAVLEEYKKRDYREKWAYELAYLYHRIGLATRCVEECDELILWFGEGKYVIKAMELKMLHVPLSATQQEKYDKRFQSSNTAYVVKTGDESADTQSAPAASVAPEVAAAMARSAAGVQGGVTTDTIPSMPIQIKSVEVSNAPTTRIPSKDLQEETQPEAETIRIPTEAIAAAQEEETEEVTIDMPEIPLAQTPDDLDIQVKTLDMGEYNTINLQKELAKNLAQILEQEDMEASDATKAIPVESINMLADSVAEEPEVTEEIVEEEPVVEEVVEEAEELIEEEPVEELQPEEEEEEIVIEPVPAITKTMDFAMTQDVVTEVNKVLGEEKPDLITEEDLLNSLQEPEAEEVVEEPIVEEAPIVEEEPVAEEAPIVEEEPVVEEAPIIEEEPVVEEASIMEEVLDEVEEETTVVKEEIEEEFNEEPVAEEIPVVVPVPEEEDLMVEKQITGQLSFDDLMAEWEETKKANEAKHLEEMRRKVMEQTGPMFKDFDAAAKASVQADLALLTPSLDVFDAQEEEEKPASTLVDFDDAEDEVTEEVTEEIVEEAPVEEVIDNNVEESDEVEELVEVDEPVIEEHTTEPVAEPIFNPTTFNTAEINGLEEKLMASLAENETETEEIPTVEEELDEVEELVEIEEAEVAVDPVSEPVAETVTEAPVPQVGSETAELKKRIIEALTETKSRASTSEASAIQKRDTGFIIADLTEEPKAQASKMQTPVQEEKSIPVRRTLTRDEKELFGSIAQTKSVQEEVANAIDNLSLNPCMGNVLVIGEKGTCTMDVAKNLVKVLSVNEDNFSGKVAKISGEVLNTRSISDTLNGLGDGALIIEQAGKLDDMALLSLSESMKKKEDGIMIVMEDTKKEMDALLAKGNMPKQYFDLRVDIAALDNDGLVNYGKEYANEQEYSIDDMGVLALYTRISEMQTNEHAVTVDEVRELVDEAIRNSQKKNMSHFMDVILAKRYDKDDMIVLREKDFLK